jgi:hypothetical protein
MLPRLGQVLRERRKFRLRRSLPSILRSYAVSSNIAEENA